MSEQPQLSEKPQSRPDTTRRVLWGGLQLLLPLLLVISLIWWNVQQTRTSVQLGDQQRTGTLNAAHTQQQKVITTSYMDHISDMLRHENLLHSATIDDVRIAAQAETITTLQQLDPGHKREVVLFLVRTQLINNDFRVIDLRDANLRGAQLHGVDLRDTYLLGADLQAADLSGSNLSYASLIFTRLVGANLQGASLQGAAMNNVDLTGANLTNANLKDAQGVSDKQLAKAKSLTGATLPDGSIHP